LLIILDNKYYTAFMAVITLFALFGDDLRLVAFKKGADDIFNCITVFSMLFFAIEIVMSSLVKVICHLIS